MEAQRTEITCLELYSFRNTYSAGARSLPGSVLGSADAGRCHRGLAPCRALR